MKGLTTINSISVVLLCFGMFLLVNSYLGPSITGMVTGTTTVLVTNVTTITMINSTVAFGSLALSQSNNTNCTTPTIACPGPFELRNDGNIPLNITISATNLWTSPGNGNPTNNYQSRCGNTTEWTGCNSTASSNTSYSGIPSVASTIISCLPWNDSYDQAAVNILITVPASESGGTKSSTVTFTAADGGVTCT